MVSKKSESSPSRGYHQKIHAAIEALQKYADRIWYPPLVALLSGLDHFILVVPVDGLLISSVILTPQRWVSLAIHTAVGSTLGALVLAKIVEIQGEVWVLQVYPSIVESTAWTWSMRFFTDYGLIVVFVSALTPMMQQPAIILGSLAHGSMSQLALAFGAGRAIKYIVLAYIGTHAPKLLGRLWGMKTELEDAGVELPKGKSDSP